MKRVTITISLFLLVFHCFTTWVLATTCDYKMDINFFAEENKFSGHQELVYTNNSPDTLSKVFYHLYYNAFQPGSMMDVRSRTIEDPDSRVGDRIAGLNKDEIGYHNIKSISQKNAV